MTVNYYSIVDQVADEFGPLFGAKNDDVAVRQFKQLLASERVTNPADYELWIIGKFDAEEGTFTPDTHFVDFGKDLITKSEVN